MKKIFTLIFLVTVFYINTYAGHVNGAQIGYTHIGNFKYEITLTVYRDCNTVQLSNAPVDIMCVSGSGSMSYSLTEISVTDITGVGSNCKAQSRCASYGSFAYGYEQHVYTGIIDVSSMQCCELLLSWEQCCRGTNSTTISTGQNFYTSATINKCIPSSLQWASTPPVLLLPKGQTVILNFSAIDSIDYDSISYSLDRVYSAAGSSISYNGSFSAQRPITFLGFPHIGLKSPAGFFIDSLTGNVCFRPTTNDVAPIAVIATEWRTVNGTPSIVGKSRREFEVTVFSQSNNNANRVPVQTTNDVFAACEGDTSVAFVDFEDPDTGDSLTLKVIHGLQWAEASMFNDRIMVKYVADTIPPGGIGSAFTIEINDNACLLNGRSVKTYGIKEGGGKFADTSRIVHEKICYGAQFKVDNPQSTLNYTWKLSGKGAAITTKASSANIAVKDTGWIKATLFVSSLLYCNVAIHTDSVYIDPTDSFYVAKTGLNDSVCYGDIATLTATPVNGTSPFIFSWTNGDSTSTTQFTPTQGTSAYYVTCTDAKGCVASAKANVVCISVGATLKADSFACKNNKVKLVADVPYSPTLHYAYWEGYPLGTLSITETITSSKTFVFTVNDASCIYKDSVKVVAGNLPALLAKSYDSVVCIGDENTINITPGGAEAPYSIKWSTGETGNAAHIATKFFIPGFAPFSAKITDAKGCVTIYNDSFRITSPQVTLTPVADVCADAPPFSLTPYAVPLGGEWSLSGVVGNIFNPAVANAGNNPVKYKYTEPTTGCSDSSSIIISVKLQPQAAFSVDSTTASINHVFRFTNQSINNNVSLFVWNFGDPNSGVSNTQYITNPSHKFSDTGWYTIKLVAQGDVCGPDSLIKTNYIHVYDNKPVNTGINNPVAQKLIVYPNPAVNIVMLETGFVIERVTITDITGREFNVPISVDGAKTTINIEGIDAGTYFITAESTNEQTATASVIINQ